MAITESSLYGLSMVKIFSDTLGQPLSDEDHQLILLDDTSTPNFDTHDFHDDLSGLITGGNYVDDTATTTVLSVSSGSMKFDHDDAVYDNGGSNDVTITNAMALVFHTNVGASATDQLIYLLDFVTAASSTNSTFTVQINASGAFTFLYNPA